MVRLLMFTIYVFLYYQTCKTKRYDGFKLLRGIPENDEHLDFFKNLTENYDVNMWQPPFVVNRDVDFIVSSDHAGVLKEEARKLNISLRTLDSNIQSAFDNQTVNTYTRRNTQTFNWNSFYHANDILNWMKDLSSQYPGEISLLSIGKTVENRHITAMKMVFKGSKRRSSVVIEGGIHAREWISPAVVTYIINELIRAREGLGGTELRKIAFNYEWYFIPVFNMDGYIYSHTTDRLWRKNRRGGYGVDLNRNFDAAFGTVSVEKINKKSELFCGPAAFSEPESQSMRNFLKSFDKRLPLSHYVAFHAYGQYFIIPYAHSESYHENYKEMVRHYLKKIIGDKVAKRINKRYGTEYKVGIPHDIMGYTASGVSACWAKKTHKIPYVAIFELRDKGTEGFALAPSKILPTCKETMDGLLELFKPRLSTLGLDDNDDEDYYYDDYESKTNGQSRTVLSGILFIKVFAGFCIQILVNL